MNILLINFEYPPLGGGGGVATAQIAEELATRNTVHVITTAYKNLPRYSYEHGVHIHRVPVLGRSNMPTASLLSLLTFAPMALMYGMSLTRKHAFDVINAHFIIPSGVPALPIAALRKIPLVVTLIGGDIYDPSKGISPHRHALLRFVIRFIATRSQALTAISHDTKQRAIELHGISQDITVIPIGLVPSSESAMSRQSLGIPDDAFLCVSIGRLVPRKGYRTLLAAWRNIPNAHLFIIGDGPQKNMLEALIRAYNLTDRVRLLGFVPEEKKHALLRAANAYVSSAQHEGFGIVFLEAMDAGLPIVASNDGGQKDFLTHGRNAFLIPPLDAHMMTQAVVELMHDIKIQQEMSTNNKNDVQQYYISKTATMLEKVLEQTVDQYERSH